MLGSEVLDVAVGIIFVFLLVSIIASAIREGIEGWLKTRSVHLEAGIRELLHDKGGNDLTAKLFNHPQVYGLFSGTYKASDLGSDLKGLWKTAGKNLPAYIPSRNFAVALMDIAARGPVPDDNTGALDTQTINLNTLRANIATNIPSPKVQRAILNAIDNAQNDIQKVQANLEAWYDSAMDRVSGWYKRSTYAILFVIGFVLAVAMNINTMAVADHLYRDKALRDAVVAHAQTAASNPEYAKSTYGEAKKDIESLHLPMGGNPWTDFEKRPTRTLGGWLLTALAASFGAPFWFDMLNKIMVVRSTVKPHEKSPEEASEDRQTAADKTRSATQSTLSQPSAPPSATPEPVDTSDGCDVRVTTITKDEALPMAAGGVR